MQGDDLSKKKRITGRIKQVQRSQPKQTLKLFDFNLFGQSDWGKILLTKLPPQQTIQPVPAQQQPSEERKAVEWIWGKVDSGGLLMFKFSEKMIESPEPVIRLAGAALFLASLFKTADTLDKKLGN